MAIQSLLIGLLDVILALMALGLIRALKPQQLKVAAVKQDVIRLRGDDVNLDNFANLVSKFSSIGFTALSCGDGNANDPNPSLILIFSAASNDKPISLAIASVIICEESGTLDVKTGIFRTAIRKLVLRSPISTISVVLSSCVSERRLRACAIDSVSNPTTSNPARSNILRN